MLHTVGSEIQVYYAGVDTIVESYVFPDNGRPDERMQYPNADGTFSNLLIRMLVPYWANGSLSKP